MRRTKETETEEKPITEEQEAPEVKEEVPEEKGDTPEEPEEIVVKEEVPEEPEKTIEVEEKIQKPEKPIEKIETPPQEVRIRYRKVGGGSLHLKNRLIKPNEVFTAFPSEIPKAFRDTVIPLEGEPIYMKEDQSKSLRPVKSAYTIQPRGKSKAWFDVIDALGKRVNEQQLTRAMAEKLKQDIER